MAVAVNLIPVTGQPLPLISRGGTSTMLTCIYIGIILSVSHFGAGMGPEEEENEEEEEETDTEEYVESSSENPIFAVETIEQTGGQTPCERPPEYSLQQLVSMTDFSNRDAAWLDSEAEGAELV